MKLILLSGTLCNQKLWQHQLASLANYPALEVIVFDITTQDSIGQMAEEVLAFTQGQFYLAAFSLGTLVAFEIIRREPERILKLALLSTSYGGPTPSAHDSLRRIKEKIEQNGLNDFLESAYCRYVDPSRQNDLALKKIYIDMAQSLGPDIAIRQITAILNWERFGDFDQIKCPTLLLCGASDTTTTPEMHQQLAKEIRNATLVTIENSGHLTLLEKPEAVNTAIENWLLLEIK